MTKLYQKHYLETILKNVIKTNLTNTIFFKSINKKLKTFSIPGFWYMIFSAYFFSYSHIGSTFLSAPSRIRRVTH